MNRNLLLTLSYNGAAYHGWQLQPNAVTVQQQLGDAFFSVSGERVNIIGCSRTDAGVHANMFCCNVRTDCTVPADKLPDALNFYLPPDIAVSDCRTVSRDFHARYDCKGKEYLYLIYNGKRRNPFYEGRAYHYQYAVDESLLNAQAQYFKGKHDFSAFCSAHTDIENKIREIYDCTVCRKGDIIELRISGDGFLYNMVRIIVGTLLDIQRGKISADALPRIILSGDRGNAGVTAPACGLYLNRVFY